MLPPKLLTSSMETMAEHLAASAWITAFIASSGPEFAPVDVTMGLPGIGSDVPDSDRAASSRVDYEALGKDFCRELVEERKRRIVLEGYHSSPEAFFVTVEKRDTPCPMLRAYHRSSTSKLCGIAFYRLAGQAPFHRDEARRLREILDEFSDHLQPDFHLENGRN